LFEFVYVVYLRDIFRICGGLVVLLFARDCGFDIVVFKEAVDFFQGHVVEIPVVADIVSVAGMVFVSGV